MRPIDPVIIDKLASRTYTAAMLVSVQVGPSFLRYSTWPYDLYLDSEKYAPRGFAFDTIRYGTASVLDSVRLSIDDVDREVYYAFKDYGNDRFPVKILLALLNENTSVIDTTSLFDGTVSSWDYSPGGVKMKVVSILEKWASVTINKFSSSCRWRVFKGLECLYAGVETSCDRTYDQCDLYSNTANFGGFRWLPSIEGKIIKTP